MPIFRKPTPKGEPYTPNPEPRQEYTRTVHAPSLTRRQKQLNGVLPKGRLPRGSR